MPKFIDGAVSITILFGVFIISIPIIIVEMIKSKFT